MTVHSGPAEPGPDGDPGGPTPPPKTPAAAPQPELPPEPTTAEMVNRPPVAYTLEAFAAPQEQAFTMLPVFDLPAAPQEPADSGVPAQPQYPPPAQHPGYPPQGGHPQGGYPPGGFEMPAGYPVPYSAPPVSPAAGGYGPVAGAAGGFGPVSGPPVSGPPGPLSPAGGAFGAVPPQNWAPQPPYVYPVPAAPPVPSSARRAKLLLIPAAVVLVLALVVVGLVVFRGKNSPSDPIVAGSATHAAATSGAPQPTGSGSPDAPTPSPTAPDLSQPDGALALSDQAATTQLEQDAAAGRATMQSLQGKWVPQVDGKCVGVAVDIGPNWVPDGTIETQNVTIQQILGFHIGLRNRFGAITAYQTEVGVASETATSGACQGKVVWFSVVPQGYASPDDANNWCAVNVPPVKECEARYVARGGEKTNVKHRY